MKKNTERLILDIALICSLIFMPWWFSGALMLLGLFFFQPFYEALGAGFVIDTLYGNPAASLILSFPATLSACFLFLLSFWVREHVRLGNRMS